MAQVIAAFLLLLVLVTGVTVVRARNLFVATILLGVYSLLMALIWCGMRALDVAFTEAAVGAGISTILLIASLIHLGSRREGAKEKYPPRLHVPSFLAALALGAALIYGTLDMPRIGDPTAPIHTRAARFYMSEEGHHATHAPNMVTAVLASYRGYDTLFETAVIFTAGMSMILLLRRTDDPERTSPARPEEGA